MRKARHVQNGHALAFEEGCHAEHLADGQHAGAANASRQNVVRLVERGNRRFRNVAELNCTNLRRLFERTAFNRDEARAEAVHAGEILVAIALINGALAAELSLQRHDRNTVRFDAAIAAAFANCFVDDHTFCRIGELANLAPAALFCGAGLVIHDDRATGCVAEFALNFVEPFAVINRAIRRQRHAFVFLRFVRDDAHFFHALSNDLIENRERRQRPVVRLATGHRDRIVVQNFVGDIDARSDARADRKQS